MRSRHSIWVIPGILTVLVGTAAAMQFGKAGMEADLTSRAQTELRTKGIQWAQVRFDGRDAILTGAAASASQSDQATNLVAELRGVRVVNSDVDQLPTASPYPFSASINEGIITLSGGAPDEAARRSLLANVDQAQSDLHLLSGVQDRGQWLAAADFALRQAQQLDTGEVSLRDMTMSLNGRAKSQTAFETISIVLDAGLPTGVQRGDINILPPLVSPFTWQVDYDGTNITLNGFVPDALTIATIEDAMPASKNLVTEVAFASGAPGDFAIKAAALVSALAQVEKGRATISDGETSFTGTPISVADADQIRAQLAPFNAAISLTPPPDLTSESDEATDPATSEPLAEQAPAIATPPLPLLNQLSSPPQVPADAVIDTDTAIAETDAQPQADDITITTPELPNLDVLASPPDVEVSPVPTPENSASAAQTPEMQGESRTDQTTSQSVLEIETPPLPHISALSAPPAMPSPSSETETQTEQKADQPAQIASLPVPDAEQLRRDAARVTLCGDLLSGFETENSILFAPASAQLTEDSAKAMNRLAVFLKQCPKVEIYVEGHTDSDGPDTANLALSVSRAETVVRELIERGVDASRLYAVGYGESVPLVPNTTREGKRQNRRIEFEIVEPAE